MRISTKEFIKIHSTVKLQINGEQSIVFDVMNNGTIIYRYCYSEDAIDKTIDSSMITVRQLRKILKSARNFCRVRNQKGFGNIHDMGSAVGRSIFNEIKWIEDLIVDKILLEE